MLNKISNDRQEVEKSWKLPQLTQDLTEKGHLSQSDEICLQGILLGYSIDKIRLNLGWKNNNTVRTHLSRGLYTDVKLLLNLNNKDKVIGSKIAGLLESKYKKQPLPIIEIDEEYLSPALISFIMREKERQGKCNLNDEDKTIDQLIILADKQIENKEFVESIKTCKKVLDKNLTYVGMIIKIASSFHELGLYDDTWKICEFLLHGNIYIRDELKSNVYNLIGDIEQKKALERYNSKQVTDALSYFASSQKLFKNTVIPVWNIVRTLLLFRNHDVSYLQRAEIKFSELLQIIESSESNFKKHQIEIIREAKEIVGLDQSWMKKLERLER